MGGCSSCPLQLGWVCLLALVCFLKILWEFVYIRSFHLWTEIIFFLLSSLDDIFIFYCVIALTKPSSTMSNTAGKAGSPLLFPILGRKLSVSHHWCDVSCGFFRSALCYSKEVCSVPWFLSCFLFLSWKDAGFYQMHFLYYWRWLYVFSSF